MPKKILFIDRDGTLIREPEIDKQVDSLEKLEFLPNAISSLARLSGEFSLVLISNQDGLGTASFPQEDFEKPQSKMRSILAGEGINFDAELICPHTPEDGCDCRKPSPRLAVDYLFENNISLDKANSFVLGDRETDTELAARLGTRFVRLNQDDPNSWKKAMPELLNNRSATVSRETKETQIELSLDLDGSGKSQINTGLPFFDHMLEQIAKHGQIDLNISCSGDLDVDAHHSIEDVAIALGAAIRNALGNKFGVNRYAFVLPMDETEASVSLDLSGRFFLDWDANFNRDEIGGFQTEMTSHFFRSLCEELKATCHIRCRGENAHHKIEAIFKAFAIVLKQAKTRGGNAIPSSKGAL